MANAKTLSKLFGGDHPQPESFEYDCIEINRVNHTVHVYDKNVHLAFKEFQLLWVLMEYRGAIVRLKDIRDRLWGQDGSVSDEFILSYVDRVREKLGSYAGSFIEEVPGIGFRHKRG